MRPEYVVHLTACGELVTGVWCPSCALPSAVSLVLLIDIHLRVLTICQDCGRRGV